MPKLKTKRILLRNGKKKRLILQKPESEIKSLPNKVQNDKNCGVGIP